MSSVTDFFQGGIRLTGGGKVKAELRSVAAEGKRSFQQIESSAAQTTAGMRLVSRYIIGNLLPAFGALQAGRSLEENIKSFELINIKLKSMSKSAEDYAQIQDFLNKKSGELNIGIETLADSYSKLLALEQSGILKRGEVNALAEGFANVKAALLGKDGEERIGDVLYGLSQALSQGTVQTAELNQVTEPVPGLLNRIAAAAGKSAGEFREMVKSGKVSSQELKGYVLKALSEFDGAAEKLAPTLSGAITSVKNAWFKLSGVLSDTAPVNFIKLMTRALGENIDVLTSVIEKEKSLSDITDAVGRTTFVVARLIIASWRGVQATISGTLVAAGDAAEYLAEKAVSVANLVPGVDLKVPQGLSDTNKVNRAAFGFYEKEFLSALDFNSKEDPVTAAEKQFDAMRAQREEIRRNSRRLQDEKTQKKGLQVTVPVGGDGTDAAKKKEKEEQKAADRIRGVVDALKFKTEQLGKSSREQEIYNELQKAGVSLESQSGQEIKRLVERYFDLSDVLEENRQRLERIQQTSDSVGDAFSSAFGNAISQGDSLRDVLQGIARDVASIIYQETVGSQIKSSVSGIVSQALSGGVARLFGGGGGPLTGTTAQLGGNLVYNALLDTFPPRAAGGPVSAGSSYLVGEAGPEIFTPKASGSITPNSALSQKAGNNIYIDARGSNDPAAVEAAVRRGIAAATPNIVGLSVRRVSDLNSRNPGFLKR
ncbi:MAG: hypothetical protein E6R03_01210 [Hyphomicrobiaceae bacterium]|nr:MAG: hypothetical protein E6R03_01210 [Hyphomicrobiaceae bacterium]